MEYERVEKFCDRCCNYVTHPNIKCYIIAKCSSVHSKLGNNLFGNEIDHIVKFFLRTRLQYIVSICIPLVGVQDILFFI